MSTSDPNFKSQITDPESVESTDAPTAETPSKKSQKFAQTATAAKMSGAFHETAGLIKRKLGELADDKELKKAGRDQQLLGKVHRFVGTLRGLRESALTKVETKRKETQAVCLKHGGRLLDVASDFVEDIKKIILK